jgi:hypothetical protein
MVEHDLSELKVRDELIGKIKDPLQEQIFLLSSIHEMHNLDEELVHGTSVSNSVLFTQLRFKLQNSVLTLSQI